MKAQISVITGVIAALSIAGVVPNAAASSVNAFTQVNLVSDGAVPAINPPDSDLVNPWGISFTGGSPFWISDNHTGKATLYNATGVKQGLVVNIPLPTGAPASPTGQVFNPGTGFNGDKFIFATEDGTIAGWRGTLGTTAETLFDQSAGNSVFKGLAQGTVGGHTYLYATDFHNGAIDVFKGNAADPNLSGTFVDPNLPSGFAPFDVQNIGDKLYVTYAKQKPGAMDDQAGPGNGFVDVYDLNGNLLGRFASQGPLNSPWGLALAPAGFGPFGGDLLVGNFGDGTINAFSINGSTNTGTFVDVVRGIDGKPLTNNGLWALTFRDSPGFNPNSLYLTAGLNDEADGLFARVDPIPEPGTFALLAGGLLAAAVRRRARSV